MGNVGLIPLKLEPVWLLTSAADGSRKRRSENSHQKTKQQSERVFLRLEFNLKQDSTEPLFSLQEAARSSLIPYDNS